MSKKIGDIQTELNVEESSKQLLAHQIHIGYGGSDLDNWLEAEEILRNKKSFSQELVTMA
ncbi:MAG: hypothetical protein HQL14_08620 [Candidatus Omnitrophica bacterium]|nr:hypothetical protein [Candidatus Omnitrophota bacterium]